MYKFLVLAVLCVALTQAVSPPITEEECICPADCACDDNCEVLPPCWNGEGEVPDMVRGLWSALPLDEHPLQHTYAAMADEIPEMDAPDCPIGCHCDYDGSIIEDSCWHPDIAAADVSIDDMPPLAKALFEALPVEGEDGEVIEAPPATKDIAEGEAMPGPVCRVKNCASCLSDNMKKCQTCNEGFKLKKKGKKCKPIKLRKGGRKNKKGVKNNMYG